MGEDGNDILEFRGGYGGAHFDGGSGVDTLKINNSVLNIELNDQTQEQLLTHLDREQPLKVFLILSNLILETIVNQFFSNSSYTLVDSLNGQEFIYFNSPTYTQISLSNGNILEFYYDIKSSSKNLVANLKNSAG